MSTRGMVGWYTDAANKHFKGVYNHFDSYPIGLGFDVYNTIKQDGVDTVLTKLQEKCSDWREYKSEGICPYCGKQWVGQPHSISGAIFSKAKEGEYPDPEAKFHQHTNRVDDQFTDKNCSPLFVEYAYIVDSVNNKIDVWINESYDYKLKNPEYKNKTEYEDYGHCKYRLHKVYEINLSEDLTKEDFNDIQKYIYSLNS